MNLIRVTFFVILALSFTSLAGPAAAQTAPEPTEAHQQFPFECQMTQTVLLSTEGKMIECEMLERLLNSEPHWAWIIEQRILYEIVEYPTPDTLNLMASLSERQQPEVGDINQAEHSPSVTFNSSVEQWRPLVAQYFAPGDVNRALRILSCESHGDANAVNPRSGAAGLFQHMPKYWTERSSKAGWGGASVFDPRANVAVAAWLAYSKGGWSHWVCKG